MEKHTYLIRMLHQQAQEASRANRAGSIPYADMQVKWDSFFKEAERIMQSFPVRNGIAYSYKRKGEREVGTEHIVIEEELRLGKLHRHSGDPLCSIQQKFPVLEPVDLERPPNCVRCLEIAERYIHTRLLPQMR